MYIPQLNDQMPQRGNRLSKWLGRTMMRVYRWNIGGEIAQLPKIVFVMGPHTSWWDFTMNFWVYLALGINASWFIADKYTKGFLGRLLAYFGAIAVDRSEASDMVTQMANMFKTREKFLLAIFPEGTRRPVPKWKTGFWHIAKKAQVPVQLVAVDYSKRATVFGPIIHLTDNVDKDIQQMRIFYKPAFAKNPAKALYTD